MESKKKIYITFGIFAVIALILIVFSIYLFKEIIKKSDELSFGKNRVAVLQKEFSDIEKFEKEYGNYRPNLERIDSLFVDSNNPVVFIEFLEKIASDCKLNLNVSVPSFKQGEAVIIGNFQISLTGSFPGIIKFIEIIENGPYLIQIKNLKIGKNQDAEKKNTNQLNSVFSIQVFAK